MITYGKNEPKKLNDVGALGIDGYWGCVTGGCVGKEIEAPIIENITTREAFTLVQENQDNPDFVIIDLRFPESFAYEHIENAINIDYFSRTFRDELNQLGKNKTYLIYSGVVCGGISGSLGWKTLGIMEELNFREVYNMTGGCIGWKLEGFPTVGEGANQ